MRPEAASARRPAPDPGALAAVRAPPYRAGSDTVLPPAGRPASNPEGSVYAGAPRARIAWHARTRARGKAKDQSKGRHAHIELARRSDRDRKINGSAKFHGLRRHPRASVPFRQAVSVPAQLGPIETKPWILSDPIGRGDPCIVLEMVRALQP